MATTPYFTLTKAKRLIVKNFSALTDAQLHKDFVRLRDYKRYMLDTELYGNYLAEGGYFVRVIDPSACGFTPKEPMLLNNVRFALDRAIKELSERTLKLEV